MLFLKLLTQSVAAQTKRRLARRIDQCVGFEPLAGVVRIVRKPLRSVLPSRKL